MRLPDEDRGEQIIQAGLKRLQSLETKFPGIKACEIWTQFGLYPGETKHTPVDTLTAAFEDGEEGVSLAPEEAWSNIVEHMVIVATTARILAEGIGITDDAVLDQLEIAGLIHNAAKRAEVVAKQQLDDPNQTIAVINAEFDKANVVLQQEWGVSPEMTELFPRFAWDYDQALEDITRRLEDDDEVSTQEVLKLLMYIADCSTEGSDTVNPDARKAGVLERCRSDEEKRFTEYDYDTVFVGARRWITKRLGIEEDSLHTFIEERLEQRMET